MTFWHSLTLPYLIKWRIWVASTLSIFICLKTIWWLLISKQASYLGLVGHSDLWGIQINDHFIAVLPFVYLPGNYRRTNRWMVSALFLWRCYSRQNGVIQLRVDESTVRASFFIGICHNLSFFAKMTAKKHNLRLFVGYLRPVKDNKILGAHIFTCFYHS